MKYAYPIVVVAVSLACIPGEQFFDIDHPKYAKVTQAFSTYEAQYDGVRITLKLSQDRVGTLQLKIGLQNSLNKQVAYDISGISVTGDGREYTPTWYSEGCCKKSQGYVCLLKSKDRAFCAITFVGGDSISECQHVEIELGSIAVSEGGASIELGTVQASRTTKKR